MPWANEHRPKTFQEMVGNPNLFGPYGTLRKQAENKLIQSAIFYGPPGIGKTTAARLLADASERPVVYLNAVDASIKDIRKAVEDNPQGVLIYLDEIQFFNKKQQQSLLPYVEDGSVTLIAATTENPWHSCYDALLSRCAIREFKRPSPEDIKIRLTQVIADEAYEDFVTDAQLRKIAESSHGDVRRAINVLEEAIEIAEDSDLDSVSDEILKNVIPNVNLAGFDLNSDVHYSLLAALQKSIRGSDADAAVFWLSRLLSGEDLISPSRRLLVIASEDIGLADPNAIVHTQACVQAAEALGFPEAWKPLTQAAIYLAMAPKSYAIEAAYGAAQKDIAQGYGATVPKHIAKGCPKDYVWPQDKPAHWVNQQYMPDDLIGKAYYSPQDSPVAHQMFDYWENVKKQLKSRPENQSMHPLP